MASFSTEYANLIGKDHATVLSTLGQPAETYQWSNLRKQENDLDTSATDLGDIWIYYKGIVHFSQSGVVLELEDDVEEFFPSTLV